MQGNYSKRKVLITGAKGQLGQCFKKIESNYPDLEMHFASYSDLDITVKEEVKHLFSKENYEYVINCAAYTNVEQAEKEPQKAFEINAEGVKNIAEACLDHDAILVHISTDYVFDGKKNTPYTEEDSPNPLNEYGKSKLAGEQHIQKILENYFIIRTSWLYSEFGHNFLKTILRKSETVKELTITTSETGTPTNANDLAMFITELILKGESRYGIYNYSNIGEATWFDFAEEVLRISGKLEQIKLEKTDNYPTFAVRPKYSVLDKKKLTIALQVNILDWKTSINRLNQNLGL
ncbi:dTDP-4-dehydrorhamnose reductase [Aquimarina sp. D1M17]|uniref:dTDP-4-dehydrorhamnose reductase n=1 Tax=Aquimarina acroporae TaxID=2937283 RepID=UPI0020BED942|nr:dTDP-4-dehydrorhamnose reductase [Aquimarina acroporae]MCK8523338.1 dTDP-4-dehydrorhamnose reductase [Aquimarina acroporae]